MGTVGVFAIIVENTFTNIIVNYNRSTTVIILVIYLSENHKNIFFHLYTTTVSLQACNEFILRLVNNVRV